MEPFVTRIGDVTIERVLPKSGPGSGGGAYSKEAKDPIPPPSVSLAKRDVDGGETISVSEDLQIFLKPPLSGVDKGSTGGLKHDGRKSRDSSISGSRETSLGRGDDRMAASGTDDSDDSESDDTEDHQSGNMDEENEVLLPQAVDKVDSSDLQQRNKSDEQSDVMSSSKVTASSIVDPQSQSVLQNSIETGAVSLQPVRTEQDQTHGGSVIGGSTASEGKKVTEEGKGKMEEDSDRGTTGSDTNKRKAQVDAGITHKKRKSSLSGKDGTDKGGSSSSSDSEDSKDDNQSSVMERKLTNMRRNIREVMSENQLDEETLAAQRQEMERLRRVQEQQRIIREVQRQIALNRQNNKTQTRVISLLQGNSSLLKQIPSTSASGSSGSTQVRLPNTVLVKLASGSGQGAGSGVQTNKKVFELLRVQKGTTATVPRPGGRSPAMSRTVLAKPRGVGPQVHMMTPSVSIAPVMSSPRLPPPSESESEGEEDSEREMLARAAALRKVAGKGKGKVTISSSSDDDDCILLSEPSSGDEGEPIDDPTNSGMHTNDLYNTPDEQGRVLVNVGRPAEEPEIFLAPQIARIIKPHQIGGVRFLFDNVVESLSRFNTSTGFGCILAHSMGLGKTLQVISFCDVFLRHTCARTVLCIMPINTLQNWLAEFNMWLPAAEASSSVNSSSNTVGSNNSSSSSSSDNMTGTQQQSIPTDPAGDVALDVASVPEIRTRNFALHVLNDSHKSMAGRSKVIQEWSKGGGVLLIGYELYRQLSLKRLYRANSKKRKRKHPDEVVDVDEDDKNKALLEEMHTALVKPGPDLVICDEGHRIKNSHASISQALKQIRSKRRIVLTGYPLQNNLLEYWCMVDFVRPNYLGTKTEFCNMFERPIQNGQCIDSTPQDIRLMRYRAHVLHSLLEGFVQRRSHSVLQVSLPQKEEYVLLLRMTKFQRKLYDTFMNEVVRTKAVPNPLKAFAVCCKIWNHPDVLFYFLKKRMYGEDVDLDLEEATAAANTPLVPGVAANPRGGPGKRGRGARGARSALGQSKRERKGSAPFRQLGNNKPAATITPQTVGTSTSNSSTNTNNSSQCSAVSGMGCMNTEHPLQQDSQGSNQPFNMMSQQNSSYNNTGPYADVQHYSSSNAPSYGYPTNPPASSYDPNYPNNGYGSSNTPYGSSNHNAAAPPYGGSGNYYPSTGGPANGQQGNYENNSMESYYPAVPGNNQGNGYQNSAAGNTTPYWQRPAGHGFYPHHMTTTGANGNASQYYGGNGSGSYGGTDTGGGSYYMGHHPHTHQQGQYGDYGNREQGNLYHGINSSGFVGEMGENNQGSGMVNMQQNSNLSSNMPNPGTMGNVQGSQNLSMNNVQNSVGSQHNSIVSQNQSTVGNTQNAVNSMQTSVEGSHASKNQNPTGTQQNPMGTPQSPVGNQQNTAGQQQNSVDNNQSVMTSQNAVSSQALMGTQQNSVAGTQTVIGNQQNQVGTPQNSMVNTHNPVGMQQDPMGNTHNSMGSLQNPVGTPQPLIGTQQMSLGNPQNILGTQQQNSVGTQHTVMANLQNPMGNSQHFMGTNELLTPQNPMGVPQNPVGSSQNPLEMSQNPVQTTQNIMGTSQNPMSSPQNTMGMSQSVVGNPQSSMGTHQNPVTPQQNVIDISQTPLGAQQNTMAPPQNVMGLPQNQVGTPQSPLSTQQNMLGTSNNPMTTSNATGGIQDCIGNSQNLIPSTQNSLNSFPSAAGNNSQNAMNIMQNAHNHMHPHAEMGGNTSNAIGNNVHDTYGGMDPSNSSQNTSYSVGNNVNYHHQHAVQNSNGRPCGNVSDSLYGSIPTNVQYLGEGMGNIPICKSESVCQNSVNNVMTVDCSSSSGPGTHGNSEASLYGPPSVSAPYSRGWDDNSGSGRCSSSLQHPEEKMGKCEANVKEESKNVGTDGSSFIANNDKPKYGEGDLCCEQNSALNSYCKPVTDPPDQRISCENQQVTRESYSSNSDSIKCLNDMKTVSPGTINEHEGKPNVVSPSNIQQNDSLKSINSPPSSLKTEDKIGLNCSNETQTDVQAIPASNYTASNVKSDISGLSDMSAQHNAFKMESRTFKSDSLSQMEKVKSFENSSPHFREKETRDIKEYDLNNEYKVRKVNETTDGGRCESLSVESKEVSCGTQSTDLNLTEGKHMVELGAGTAMRNTGGKEDPGIPYDWATELLKNYIPGSIENSAKMEVLFCILEEAMALGDRVLVFSQSLFTLNLIEDFLQRSNLPGRQEKWARNWNYYRLDGSTSALEREKLINEYNSNPNIHLFLVSTRAGSLGINLVGANRVVVFDASWNPCHDTQAVCRVYRYGQKKPCFVYRLVMDNCLEKKIYDRQINKQGMADRVVDECNPDAHLSIKEVTNLCWDNEQDTEPRDLSAEMDKYIDVVMQKLLQRFGTHLSKEPFHHESLLVDRKEKKLSQAEKRLAKRSYELEKQANINYSHRPQYAYYPGSTAAAGNPGMQGTGLQIRAIRTDASGGVMPKPVASVRPMQAELSQQLERGQTNRSTVTTLNTSGRSRWIPAEVWQRQGMSAQEMTLPLDVVIPTNSPDRASIVLKAGQRVMVLKSPKGIYMQLENGKIIAIRTAFKVGGAGKGSGAQHQESKPAPEKPEINAPEYKKESNIATINRTANVAKVSSVLPFKNNSAITIIPKSPQPQQRGTGKPMGRPGGNSSGGGIVKQDVTVKPWGPRTGTSVGDISIAMGGNRNVGSQQPMAQARPYFHRASTGSSADMGSAKPYYHQETSSDHGMIGHHTSDEGSSGAENMTSTPCGEDRDGMDGGALKSPSSDDFNQDNSMSSHAFGNIQESNMNNRSSSYDGHLGDDSIHDSGPGMSVTYGGNHSEEMSMNNAYGRQLGQDVRDSSIASGRSFRRQMDQGLQGAGNVGHPFVRQTDQIVQETSVGVSHGYGRQVDQGMHDPSHVSHRFGRHVEQTYHDSSAVANHGFGRQVEQDTGSVNRPFVRPPHDGMPYNQHNQTGGYDEHKDTNLNRSDAASSRRYCHAETDSGTTSGFQGPYEDNWQQGQGFRGMSRVGGGSVTDGRNYQQPFKGSQHGVDKHSLSDNSTRDKPHSSFPDYSHRQQHQESELPTFQSEVSDSGTSGNDSGVEILPLPTPASKELLSQQSTHLNAPHGKTTSLKNYRHNSFNTQHHGRDIESSTSGENTVAPVRRNIPEKSVSGEHYMKSPQQTSYSNDIKSPPSFQKSNDELKASSHNIPVSVFPHGGNIGNLPREDSSSGVMSSHFIGTGNPPVSQRTLHTSKNRQKNPSNTGRFNAEANSVGNFSASVIPPTPATKSKRSSNRAEQQHFEFESHDAIPDSSRINPQQQLPGKSATRNQVFPMQPQTYHSHTSPQAPSHAPPSSNPASSAAASVPKKGRGNKNASSDRSPSYSSGGTNTDSESQHHTEGSNSQQSSPQNMPVQSPHSAPVFPQNPQYQSFDGSSNKPLEPYGSPVYGHQQYYGAPGYYGGFSGPQQHPVTFGGNAYYSGDSQYGTGRVDASESAVNKHNQKGNQSQSRNSPPQQQSTQPVPQTTTPSKTQLPSGIGAQKKDMSNQLGNSAPASDSPTKAAASVTNPSTPTMIRDMASPNSTSGGSRSGNNSARSTPAAVTNTNIMQEPNSPQLHFNTPTPASSTSLENRSPVQYNAAMTTNPMPLDPKSPLQYNSSTVGGNSTLSTAPSLQYNTNASSSNFAAGTPSAPQSGIIPPQSPYEPMMLGGYPAGAGGSGYAPPPPPPPPPPGMGYGSYSNPANQYEADYARASMYSAFHRPDPHPHPFAPGHPPGFLPPPQGANYYPQNMYGPAPYGTPDPAYYSNPFLNAVHQHPYPTLPGTAQNPGPHPQ